MSVFFFLPIAIIVIAGQAYTQYLLDTSYCHFVAKFECSYRGMFDFGIEFGSFILFSLAMYIDSVLLGFMAANDFSIGCDNYFFVYLLGFFCIWTVYGFILISQTAGVAYFRKVEGGYVRFKFSHLVDILSIGILVLYLVGVIGYFFTGWLINLSICDITLELRRYQILTFLSFLLTAVLHQTRDQVIFRLAYSPMVCWVTQFFLFSCFMLLICILVYFEDRRHGNLIRCIRCYLLSSLTCFLKIQTLYFYLEIELHRLKFPVGGIENRFQFQSSRWS